MKTLLLPYCFLNIISAKFSIKNKTKIPFSNFSKTILLVLIFNGNKIIAQPNANNWRWIKGSSGVSQPNIFGTMGIPSSSNTPSGRHAQSTWGAINGKMYIMGGYGLDITGTNNKLLNDLWSFDPTTNNWVWLKGSTIGVQPGIYGTKGLANSTNIPGSRELAGSWVFNSALYQMGGFGIDANNIFGNLNDLWKYDLTTNNWTWLRGSSIVNQIGVYGNQGAGSTSNEPGARDSPATWNTNFLYLFGGYGYSSVNTNEYLNDLWKYDPITNNWTWLKGSNIQNQPGIYGTQGVADPNNTPGARNGATSWELNGKLYLFGGYGFDGFGNLGLLNDLWQYDPVTNNWTLLKGSNSINQPNIYGTKGIESTSNRPSGRSGGMGWSFNGKLFLFGGESGDDGIISDDLWQYDPPANKWTWIKGSNLFSQIGNYGTIGVSSPTNNPGARFNTATTYLYNFKVYLMGGLSPDINQYGYKNDVWEYTPCTQMSTIANGNWNDPNTWACGKVPNIFDQVFIGHTIVLNGNAVCKNITYTNGGAIAFGALSNLVINYP